MTRVPLSILDLIPVAQGRTGREALQTTVELARAAEESGYHRFWVAEHHLAAGVASSSPGVLTAIIAAHTSTIRVGSGAVLLSTTSPLIAAEQFGTTSAFYPGRVDLGVGRAFTLPPAGTEGGNQGGKTNAAGEISKTPSTPDRYVVTDRIIDSVVFPQAPPRLNDSALRERYLAEQKVVSASRVPAPFGQEIDLILGLQGGGYTDNNSRRYVSPAVSGSDFELHILASSGGESAIVAAQRGLPLVANYHVSPATTLETIAAYRKNFVPGVLEKPYVIVSVDVLVATSTERARQIAAPFGQWVASIRAGTSGAEQYSAPNAVRGLTQEEQHIVADRLATRFVGTPQHVVERLEALQRVTQADELLTTTVAHSHLDRVASLRLLAHEWQQDSAGTITKSVDLPELVEATQP